MFCLIFLTAKKQVNELVYLFLYEFGNKYVSCFVNDNNRNKK